MRSDFVSIITYAMKQIAVAYNVNITKRATNELSRATERDKSMRHIDGSVGLYTRAIDRSEDCILRETTNT